MRIFAALVSVGLIAFGLGWTVSERARIDHRQERAQVSMGPAVRAALADGDRLNRLGRLTGLLERLDVRNLDEALAVYDEEVSMLGECEIRPFFGSWARFDPVSALAHAQGWTSPVKRRAGVEATIQSWALREPMGARDAVAELIEGYPALRKLVIEAFVGGWVHSGQPGVLPYVAKLPEYLRGVANVAMVGAQARRLGSEELMSWADEALVEVGTEFEDAKFQKGLFRRVTRAVARRDPQVAAIWVGTHAQEAYATDGALLVTEQWLPRDPDAAFDWLSSVATDELRYEAIATATDLWIRRDFETASEWIESATPTRRHDPALGEYARALASRGEAEAGIEWAEQIQDEERRRASLSEVATRWYRQDPSATEKWLENSPLDEAARQAIQQAPRRAPGRRGAGRRPGRGAGLQAPGAQPAPQD